jgi:hypothetical protein
MNTSAPRSGATQPIRARMVLDRSGKPWRIAELLATPGPGEAPARCLVLSSENRYVRVWNYPPDWMRRTVDELLAGARATPNAAARSAG